MRKKITATVTIFFLILGLFIPESFCFAQVSGIIQGANIASAAAATAIPSWLGGLTTEIIASILSPILLFIRTILAAFLALSGQLLNLVIDVTILNMSQGIRAITGLNDSWKIVRDVFNMAFIFLLLYEAFSIIIGRKNYSEIGKTITGIVITALLINFSMFFTKVIVDASNIVTIGFYESIEKANVTKGATITGLSNVTGTATSITIEKGLAGAFMNATDAQKLYDGGVPPTAKDLAILHLGASVIFLILIISFLVISAMLVARYIVIIFLLVLSPIGFIGFGFPSMRKYQNQWWESLTGQCLFAPIYMFLTKLVLVITNTGVKNAVGPNDGDWTKILSGGNLGLLLNYTIVIGLAITALAVAKDFAKKGHSSITKLTDNLTSFAGGTLLGGAAVAGRQTLGRAGKWISERETLQQKADQGSQWAKIGLWTGNKMGSGSFDVRKNKIVEDTAKTTGINLGKGLPFIPKAGEGGRIGEVKESKKKEEEKLDEIMKRYVDKRNWDGLADVIEARSENDQNYVYKKLSERNRSSLEDALGDNKDLIKDLRSKLPMDDQIKAFTNKNNWGELAEFVTEKTESEQNYIYEKLSARDRVELDKKLTGLAGKPGVTNSSGKDIIKRMRESISVEEMEKTEKAEKEDQKKTKNKLRLVNLDDLVTSASAGTTPPTNPATGIPYTYKELIGKGSGFPKKEASDLSVEALKDPEVIKQLSTGHLANIMSNHDNFEELKESILKIINDNTNPYELQREQLSYVNSSNTIKSNWGIT